jgi:hypothetical protein
MTFATLVYASGGAVVHRFSPRTLNTPMARGPRALALHFELQKNIDSITFPTFFLNLNLELEF